MHLEYLLHKTLQSLAIILKIKLEFRSNMRKLLMTRSFPDRLLCQLFAYPGITGCSLEGDGPMAFDECETTATTAVVQQHE